MKRAFMTTMLALFLLAGLGFLAKGIHTGFEARASLDWPAAPGKVLGSRVATRTENRKHHGRKRRLVVVHRADVQYRYEVDGGGFVGTRVSFHDIASSDPGPAHETVARYPADSVLTVYYDPEDPTRSVLEPGPAGGSSHFFMLGGGFLFVSIFGLTLIWVVGADVL